MGIDAGGTFTDVCLFEETGELRLAKVPSTLDNPSRAITTGLERILRDGGRQGEVTYFGHGSTVATNALIEGRGVPTGLITTAGFRDLLELGRNRRLALYDLHVDKRSPWCAVTSGWRYESASTSMAPWRVPWTKRKTRARCSMATRRT